MNIPQEVVTTNDTSSMGLKVFLSSFLLFISNKILLKMEERPHVHKICTQSSPKESFLSALKQNTLAYASTYEYTR
jgi:hypothetical protein